MAAAEGGLAKNADKREREEATPTSPPPPPRRGRVGRGR